MTGASQSLTWHGDALTARAKAAQIAGVNATMGACVIEAKSHHPWNNQTATLEGGIDIVTYAHRDDQGTSGVWGVRDVIYARIHELGGTIVPRHTKYLAIPVSPEAKRVASPRDMPGLVFVQSRRGQPLLVDGALGKSRSKYKLGALKVHFVLRRQVVIPPRPYLRPAADKIYPQLSGNVRKAWESWKPSDGAGA